MRNVPIYRRLPGDLVRQLQGHVQVFLAEKNFESAGELEMSDEIRVTIAAQACVLFLNRRPHYFPNLSSVIVYPEAFVVEQIEPGRWHHVATRQVVAGQSFAGGAVAVAWSEVLMGTADPGDGHNVVLHEFAHQLDQEDGAADGAPLLDGPSAYTTWTRVLGTEFERLRLRLERTRKTVIREYGASDPAEFFAVATETFFEKPAALQQRHPELYVELRKYYRTDPLAWNTHAGSPDQGIRSDLTPLKRARCRAMP